MKALVIEDDVAVAKITRRVLEEEGFVVDVAATGEEGKTLAFSESYDVIILDLGLPDRPGIGIVQELRREKRSTPIMILTGAADSDTTVRALDAGADDYLTKPIKVDEFGARVRALIRRGGAQRTETISLGNVVLNRLTRQLLVNGAELRLTAKEFALLEHLLLRVDVVVTRTELLESIWDTNFDPGTNVIDVSISRVRKKLREAGAAPQIEGRRGMGFTISLAAGDD
ncbi:MAG: response regulator transcription factor [Gemmatimonadota bacterium]|nr:response regulator transcription factor [Gemmatimonadota bacterium]